jgi:hypothetical protein
MLFIKQMVDLRDEMSSPSLYPPARVQASETHAEIAEYTEGLLCALPQKLEEAVIPFEHPYENIRWFEGWALTRPGVCDEGFSEAVDGGEVYGNVLAIDGAPIDELMKLSEGTIFWCLFCKKLLAQLIPSSSSTEHGSEGPVKQNLRGSLNDEASAFDQGQPIRDTIISHKKEVSWFARSCYCEEQGEC